LAADLPEPGALTHNVKVIEEKSDAREYSLVLEGSSGTTQLLKVRRNRSNVTVHGGTESGSGVMVTFRGETGIQRQTISFRW
jgi:hypothetical protein